MLTTALLLFANTLLFSLRLSGSSFPKPLTAQEEQHYLTAYAAGDTHARDVLIERNLRLVAHVVKKYYTANDDQEDLISIGTIGLIKAVTSFKPEKGARLATYAARCIENAILSPTTFRWRMGCGGIVWGWGDIPTNPSLQSKYRHVACLLCIFLPCLLTRYT